MTEGLKLDDLLVTCPRCPGCGLEPEPGAPPRAGGDHPDLFKYNVGARACADCGGSTRGISPAGEVLLAFLRHPLVASKVEEAAFGHRPFTG